MKERQARLSWKAFLHKAVRMGTGRKLPMYQQV